LGILNLIGWTLFATSPTKEEVDGFLSEYAGEYKFVTDTDPYIEYPSAHYLRTHTACVLGKIFRVTYKGEIERRNVCVTSTVIGCPSAAIVMEEYVA